MRRARCSKCVVINLRAGRALALNSYFNQGASDDTPFSSVCIFTDARVLFFLSALVCKLKEGFGAVGVEDFDYFCRLGS